MEFAGFEVLGRVAEGSSGVVWQARQVALGRLVAIKELSPALLAVPGFLERFRAEAQVLSGLDDRHVVR
ncbi:MAG: serine/threonine protein kinase, partial [Geodermatophilaceae bacterium]|nr:serine/threonine protein kinase [Geodermatophilaceae bacterium]